MTKTHIEVVSLDKEKTLQLLNEAGKKQPDSLKHQKGPFLMVYVPEDRHRAKSYREFTESKYRNEEGHRIFVGDAHLAEATLRVGGVEKEVDFYEASEGIINQLGKAGLIEELKREALINQYRGTQKTKTMAERVGTKLAGEKSRGFGKE